MSARRERSDPRGAPTSRHITVELDEFGWEALERESERLGISKPQTIRLALLYFVADSDSGRIARRLPEEMLSPPIDPLTTRPGQKSQ